MSAKESLKTRKLGNLPPSKACRLKGGVTNLNVTTSRYFLKRKTKFLWRPKHDEYMSQLEVINNRSTAKLFYGGA